MSCLRAAGLAFLGVFQVSGGPDWIDTARYDIVAKSDESLNEDPHLSHFERQAFYDRQRYRLRSLLADRFHLTFHMRAKDMPVYVLVVDNNGLKLPLSSDDAAASASAPSIFVVLRHLGLKLESEKAPGEVLVVDHVERPSQN